MSSNIYETKENPWTGTQEKNSPPNSPRRAAYHRSREKTFDEATSDIAQTHRRRSSNRGFRRFLHLLKQKEFGRKFWGIIIGTVLLFLLLLFIWDWFFRYPSSESRSEAVYSVE